MKQINVRTLVIAAALSLFACSREGGREGSLGDIGDVSERELPQPPSQDSLLEEDRPGNSNDSSGSTGASRFAEDPLFSEQTARERAGGKPKRPTPDE